MQRWGQPLSCRCSNRSRTANDWVDIQAHLRHTCAGSGHRLTSIHNISSYHSLVTNMKRKDISFLLAMLVFLLPLAVLHFGYGFVSAVGSSHSEFDAEKHLEPSDKILHKRFGGYSARVAEHQFRRLGEEGRRLYKDSLWLDFWFIPLYCATIIAMLFLGRELKSSSKMKWHTCLWPLLPAFFDIIENSILIQQLSAFQQNNADGLSPTLIVGASAATIVKITGIFYFLIVLSVMTLSTPAVRLTLQWLGDLLFKHVPFLFDSAFRHIEFRMNRIIVHHVDPFTGSAEYIERKLKPASIMLIIVTFFSVYGPTFDSMCSLGGLTAVLVAFVVPMNIIMHSWLPWWPHWRRRIQKEKSLFFFIHQDYVKIKENYSKWKAKWAFGILFIGLFLLVLTLYLVIKDPLSNGFENPAACRQVSIDPRAYVQYFIALSASIVALRYLSRSHTVKDALIFISIYFLSLSVSVFFLTWFSPNGWLTPEASYLPYLNIFIIVVPAVFAIPLTAVLKSRFSGFSVLTFVFRNFKEHHQFPFSKLLKQTELFKGRDNVELTLPRLAYGFVAPWIHRPLYLLLFPSQVALVAPTDDLKLLVLIAFCFSYLILIWGRISYRWESAVNFITHYFFQGLPLFVSILVIGIGMARLLGVHYVSFLLDVAPFGAVTTIVLMLYALFWLFDYWQNQPLQLRLLNILGATLDPNIDSIPKPKRINYLYEGPEKTSVLDEGRQLQIHGPGRFAVTGAYRKHIKGDSGEYEFRAVFHTWEAVRLFNEIIDQARERSFEDYDDLLQIFRDLRRRINQYRAVMNIGAIVALAVVISGILYFNGNYFDPIARAQRNTERSEHFDLQKKLRHQKEQGRPAIMIAASGGGTRAALYTYATLRALAQNGLVEDVVLTSGVSGGGVSLAYFAAHYNQLNGELRECKNPKDLECIAVKKAWERFGQTMWAPFVGDVLEGVLEPRVFGIITFGSLLKESFDRRFYQAKEHRKFFSDVPLGLILNTTITGHPYDDAQFLNRSFAGSQEKARDYTYTTLRGGRLVFHNLAPFKTTLDANPDVVCNDHQFNFSVNDICMPYRQVIDGTIELTSAAALTANFPPVFPDAHVTVRQDDENLSYKVTDGGATDNRGLVSLLYALKSTLSDEEEPISVSDLPPIYIVVAEASAFSFDYTSKFGLGAAFSGAKEILANGLLTELYEDVQKKAPLLKLVYLPMPSAFRTRGGLGTHWLMPSEVELSNPRSPSPSMSGNHTKTLSKYQIKCLLEGFYGKANKTCLENDVDQEVLDWICTEWSGKTCLSSNNLSADVWQEFLTLLASEN